MGLSQNPALWFVPFVAPIGIWIAWTDLSAMRIPNRAVLALVAAFMAVGFLALPLATYGLRLAQMAVVLALGFVLSSAGGLGAGDAKFLAASAPFVAWEEASAYALLLALVLAAAYVTHRGARAVPRVRRQVPHWSSWDRRDFPMGFALGPALILYLALSATGALAP